MPCACPLSAISIEKYTMKIGIDIRTLMESQYSGVSEYTLNLLTEIFRQDQKNQYKLFYNSGRDISARMPKFDFPNVEIVASRYPNKLFNNILQRIFQWPKIDQKLGVDLFFVPNIGFISLSDKCKKIITIHDLSFLRYGEFFSWKRRLWHKLIDVKKIVRSFDCIIAVSENTKRDLIESCGISEEKIKVIYSGIGKEFKIISKEENNQVKTKYNLPDKFILFLGTIEPRKNIGGLIRAYSQFRNDNPEMSDVNLVLVGGRGWKFKNIFREYENSKYKSDIIWLDYIDATDKPAVYNLASLFVYPSFYEGFGFPPLEAMACGVPVISSNSSSLPEIVADAGILITPNNISELATAIETVLKNEDLRKTLISRGLENVKRFSWEECAGEYIRNFGG